MTGIEAFLDGADDPATLADLRERITRWMTADSGPDLHRMLGLPGRASARIGRRDELLRRAAASMPGRRGERAKELLARVRTLEVRRAGQWRLNGVPENADPVEVLLYEAMRYGDIPTTTKMIGNILRGDA